MITITGIDNSITSPAIVFFHCDENTLDIISYDYINLTDTKKYLVEDHIFKMPKYTNELERIITKNDFLVSEIKKRNVTHYAMESYSYGSSGLIFNLAENSGYLKTELYKAGLKLRHISPSSNKMFFTKKGNADKQKMIETYRTQYNNPLNIPDVVLENDKAVNDIVDAFSLCLCLWTEMRLRKGLVKLEDLSDNIQKVFKSDPKKKKVSPLDLEFI